MSNHLIADVTINDGSDFSFPEQSLVALQDRLDVALCFSGGGSRSAAASTGYLRGLMTLGLIDKVRYISAVSGGSFACSVFTYYRAGPDDDAALLGPVTAPSDLTEEALAADMPSQQLLSVCTTDLRSFIRPALGRNPANRVWQDIAGQVVLAPFGLYDPKMPRSATLTERLPDILKRNPGLSKAQFVTPRAERPYLIINACLLAPTAVGPLKHESPVTLQFSPLYTGSPLRRTLYRVHRQRRQRSMSRRAEGLPPPCPWSAARIGGSPPRRPVVAAWGGCPSPGAPAAAGMRGSTSPDVHAR